MRTLQQLEKQPNETRAGVRKHANGFYQPLFNERLIIGAWFRRKRDAMNFAEWFKRNNPNRKAILASLPHFKGFRP